jgi:hypothetical protein
MRAASRRNMGIFVRESGDRLLLEKDAYPRLSLFPVFGDKLLHLRDSALEDEIAVVRLAFGDLAGNGHNAQFHQSRPIILAEFGKRRPHVPQNFSFERLTVFARWAATEKFF